METESEAGSASCRHIRSLSMWEKSGTNQDRDFLLDYLCSGGFDQDSEIVEVFQQLAHFIIEDILFDTDASSVVLFDTTMVDHACNLSKGYLSCLHRNGPYDDYNSYRPPLISFEQVAPLMQDCPWGKRFPPCYRQFAAVIGKTMRKLYLNFPRFYPTDSRVGLKHRRIYEIMRCTGLFD